MKRWIRTGLISILLIGLVILVGGFMQQPHPLIIQGEVDATQVEVAAKIYGRVKTLSAAEGQPVKKGDLLATLDSPEIKAKLRQALGAQKAARAQQDKAYSGTRKEKIRTAFSVWQKADAASRLAEKTYLRIQRLHEDGIVSTQKRDEAQAGKEAAAGDAEAAQATYEMARAGAREEDKTAAGALVDQTAGAVSEIMSYIAETKVKAPISGEVVEIIIDPGELVSPGLPLVSIVALDDTWVTFNLREDLLAAIRMGSVIPARFPALGDKPIRLKVNFIKPVGNYATWRATKASGDFDLKTFEIRAVPVSPEPGLRPGMTAWVNWDQVRQQ